jgi:hypothetical protein
MYFGLYKVKKNLAVAGEARIVALDMSALLNLYFAYSVSDYFMSHI